MSEHTWETCFKEICKLVGGLNPPEKILGSGFFPERWCALRNNTSNNSESEVPKLATFYIHLKNGSKIQGYFRDWCIYNRLCQFIHTYSVKMDAWRTIGESPWENTSSEFILSRELPQHSHLWQPSLSLPTLVLQRGFFSVLFTISISVMALAVPDKEGSTISSQNDTNWLVGWNIRWNSWKTLTLTFTWRKKNRLAFRDHQPSPTPPKTFQNSTIRPVSDRAAPPFRPTKA